MKKKNIKILIATALSAAVITGGITLSKYKDTNDINPSEIAIEDVTTSEEKMDVEADTDVEEDIETDSKLITKIEHIKDVVIEKFTGTKNEEKEDLIINEGPSLPTIPAENEETIDKPSIEIPTDEPVVDEPVVDEPTDKPELDAPAIDKPTDEPSDGPVVDGPVQEEPIIPNPPAQEPEVPNPPIQTPEVEKPVINDKFMAQVEQAIFKKVNEERAKAGVSALTYNNTMQKYARIKSQDMGDNNYFNHKDLSGNLITVKMKSDGVSYRAWGENIAYIGGVNDANALATQFMTNWMNSSGHRANILSTNFESIGVGVYKIGNKVYATQEFYK